MTLRLALRSNAAFSVATGALLFLAPGMVSDWLGVSISGWLRLLGLGLLGHAVLLGWAARRPTVEPWARLNLAAVAPYPVAMVGIVAVGLVDTGLGRALLLADGVVVAVLAFFHWYGLRSGGEGRHPLPA